MRKQIIKYFKKDPYDDYSNNLLTDSLKLAIDSDNLRDLLLDHYNGDSDVILFNKSNL